MLCSLLCIRKQQTTDRKEARNVAVGKTWSSLWFHTVLEGKKFLSYFLLLFFFYTFFQHDGGWQQWFNYGCPSARTLKCACAMPIPQKLAFRAFQHIVYDFPSISERSCVHNDAFTNLVFKFEKVVWRNLFPQALTMSTLVGIRPQSSASACFRFGPIISCVDWTCWWYHVLAGCTKHAAKSKACSLLMPMMPSNVLSA